MRILVCNPTHFAIEYSINPWMSIKNPTDKLYSTYQWNDLIQILKSLKTEIHEMSGEPNLPDIVFTANAGIVYQNKFIASNFKYPERQPEKAFYKRKFEELGFEVYELEDVFYEGAGDALFSSSGELWCGYGFRSEIAAHYMVRDIFSVEIRPLFLVDPHFYHLDTCFCPLRGRDVLIYPSAFDRMSHELIESEFSVIDVPSEEAHRFACNAVLVENNVVIPAGCPVTAAKLEMAGYQVIQTSMSEFVKAGGACKCLTLRF